MANLKIGSTGSEVKKLQETLISAGYDVGKTGADGVLGKNTEAAIKQYQKDNGLTVDGIAGKNTLGKLYGNNTTPAATTTVTQKPTTTTSTPATNPTTTTPAATAPVAFDYPDLVMSDNYNQAMGMLAQNEAARPGEYAPVWEDEASSWLDKFQSRDSFSYDPNSDALYQQYADQYIQQGRLAMEDTMGQAAALTGGYGNSYAQSVGQQVYNQYLGKINEVGLELYDRAYNRYNQEGQDMLAMYDLYMDREAQERAKHQDSVENWYRENALLQGKVDSIYAQEFNAWDTGRENAWNEFLLGREDMTAAKSNLITLMTATGHNPTDEELAAAGMTREQANSYIKAYKESVDSAPAKDNTEYTVLDYDEQAKWSKELEEALEGNDPMNAILNVGDRMEGAGVDPLFIQRFVQPYIERIANHFPDPNSDTDIGPQGWDGRWEYYGW